MSTEQSTAPDIIFVRDLRIDTVIGIYGWERQVTQTLVFDLEMATDIRAAAASDRIEDTLNYKAVAKRVMEFVQASRFELLPSAGTYFQLASYRRISDSPDTEFVRYLTQEAGVAAIPVSAFFADGRDDRVIRFCFAKNAETLATAAGRLAVL